VREPTHRFKLSITWSKGVPLRRVRVDVVAPDGTSRNKEFLPDQLDKHPSPDGRPFYEVTYDYPPRNQKVVISWWVPAGR
jgi:hypothetical protein